MKIIALLFVVTIALAGCAQINPQISKFDLENHQANKQLAKDQMTTWSFSSGFITGLGLTSPLAFPIKNGDELRAIINSPAMILAKNDLDEVCKRLNYWNEEDYWLGFSLGAKVRAGSQAAIQMVKDLFPELIKYAPAVFGL